MNNQQDSNKDNFILFKDIRFSQTTDTAPVTIGCIASPIDSRLCMMHFDPDKKNDEQNGSAVPAIFHHQYVSAGEYTCKITAKETRNEQRSETRVFNIKVKENPPNNLIRFFSISHAIGLLTTGDQRFAVAFSIRCDPNTEIVKWNFGDSSSPDNIQERSAKESDNVFKYSKGLFSGTVTAVSHKDVRTGNRKEESRNFKVIIL